MYSSSKYIIILIICIKLWSFCIKYRLKLSPERGLFFPTFNSKISSNELRVLTYNVYLRPPLISHKHGDYKNKRCSILSKLLHSFDIIFLQEVHTCFNFRCSDIIREAIYQGLPYHVCTYGPSVLSRQVSNNGLLILSRYPIIEKGSLSYNESATYDSVIEKGAIYAKIMIQPNIFIYVINTHLQSSYLRTDINAMKIREKQLIQLESWISEKKMDNLICGGDFNIDSHSSELHILQKYMNNMNDSICGSINNDFTIEVPYNLDNKEETSICTVCHKCNHNIKPNITLNKQRVDYLFYSPSFQVLDRRILPMNISNPEFPFTRLSDHKAVYTHFIIKINDRKEKTDYKAITKPVDLHLRNK